MSVPIQVKSTTANATATATTTTTDGIGTTKRGEILIQIKIVTSLWQSKLATLRSARSLVRSTCVTFIVINNVNSVCVCSSRPRHRDEFGLYLVRRRLLLLLLLLCAHCTSRTLTDAERMNKYCSE